MLSHIFKIKLFKIIFAHLIKIRPTVHIFYNVTNPGENEWEIQLK